MVDGWDPSNPRFIIPPWANTDVKQTYKIEKVSYGSGTDFIIRFEEPPTTAVNVNYPAYGATSLSLPMGWHEAEEKSTTKRVEKAKKKVVQEVKEVKRLVMGPKASRWR